MCLVICQSTILYNIRSVCMLLGRVPAILLCDVCNNLLLHAMGQWSCYSCNGQWFNKTITIHMCLLFIQRYSFQFPEFSNLSNLNLLNQLICAILWLLHGEYRFPEKNSSTFQGLFQGHFRSFQGHFQVRSRYIAVKKYRITRQNLEFPCNLPIKSPITQNWYMEIAFFFTFLYVVFFIEMRSIYDNSR